jgi:hypothetical protein
MLSSSYVAYLLLIIGLSAERAKALPIPLAFKLTNMDTRGASRAMSLTELAILSIFTTGK